MGDLTNRSMFFSGRPPNPCDLGSKERDVGSTEKVTIQVQYTGKWGRIAKGSGEGCNTQDSCSQVKLGPYNHLSESKKTF